MMLISNAERKQLVDRMAMDTSRGANYYGSPGIVVPASMHREGRMYLPVPWDCDCLFTARQISQEQ